MGKRVLFPFTIKDREFCMEPGEIYVDLSTTIVLGIKTIRVWNNQYLGFQEPHAFYVNYQGVEYGSLTVDQSIFDFVPCGDSPIEFRLHEDLISFEFE